MDEFIDSDGDMMVGRDPIWMTAPEYSVLDTIERVGWGILEPFKEEVGVVGGLTISYYPTRDEDGLPDPHNWS
jgi:hypothetical protein